MGVVAAILVIVFALLFGFVYLPMARRGRAARADNGGRHTSTWWVCLGLVVVCLVGLAVLKVG